MKDILKYRLVIIDNDGEIIKYPWKIGLGHQDCLDEFSRVKGYDYSSYDFLIQEGNCLFYNCGLNMLVVRLPKDLNESQLYAIDYIENFLDNVTYMEVSKGLGKEQKEYIFDRNIRENFSMEIIQSFYNKVNRSR